MQADPGGVLTGTHYLDGDHAAAEGALAEINSLESYARGQGYDNGTVRAFLKDRTARAEIYERAETYLAENGVVAGDEDSYCRLGRAEIGAGSLIGSLIRAR